MVAAPLLLGECADVHRPHAVLPLARHEAIVDVERLLLLPAEEVCRGVRDRCVVVACNVIRAHDTKIVRATTPTPCDGLVPNQTTRRARTPALGRAHS